MASSSSLTLLSQQVIVVSILVSIISNVDGCFTSIFGFGDSITDTGNSHILALSGSTNFSNYDFPPYGRSFFHRPTGRCSDGRLIIDFIAKGLGLPILRPYFRGKRGGSRHFRKGVNFAMVGATALDNAFFEERGIRVSDSNVSLGVQMGFFKHLLPSLCSSSSDCKELLQNSLIVMGEIGGNDYNDAFFNRRSIEEIKEFVPHVIHAIASAINELIELGAVTFLVPGNFPIGCSPSYLLRFKGSNKEEYDPITGCLTWLNQFAEYHNEQLQKELDQIRELHPDVNIIYADYYNIAMRFYQSPDEFGFTETLVSCCGNLSVICGGPWGGISCENPSSYVSWDALHYTEATYRWISKDVLEQLFMLPNVNSSCLPLSMNMQKSVISS